MHRQCTERRLHGLAIDVDQACFDLYAEGAERMRPVQAELCCASTRQLTAFVDAGPMKRTYRISQVHSHLQTRCSHVGRDRREGAQCWRYCCWTVMRAQGEVQLFTGCLSSKQKYCVFSQYQHSHTNTHMAWATSMTVPAPQEPFRFSDSASILQRLQSVADEASAVKVGAEAVAEA